MRYLTSIITIWLLATLGLYAQEEGRLTISGHLIDADLKEPMVHATIQMFWTNDSSFVGGTVSNERGNFSIEAPSNGTFRLRFSSVGFQTIEREVTIRKNQSQDLGNLLMNPDAVLLKGAVVTSRAAQVVVKKDTLVYNPEHTVLQKGLP